MHRLELRYDIFNVINSQDWQFYCSTSRKIDWNGGTALKAATSSIKREVSYILWWKGAVRRSAAAKA